MLTVDDQIKVALNNLSETNRIVFFVGAGISVTSGYALWKEASARAVDLAREKGLPPGATVYATEKLAKQAYYEVFQILKDELTTPSYSGIGKIVFAGGNYSSLHRLLVRIPARGIITTNFDDCLQAACVIERSKLPQSDIPNAMASDEFFVVQPHGNIQIPETMVLATSDWRRVEENGRFKDLLAQAVNDNQIVFLGYGLGDPDFNHLWDRILKERLFRAPALYCCAEGAISPERTAELRGRNVQVVEFPDQGKFEFVPRLLEAIYSRPQQAPAPSGAARNQAMQDLERYVFLCLQFSPDQESRLALVCKAIILEKLSAGSSDAFSQQQLLGHVEQTLGQESKVVRDAVTLALSQLTKAGITTVLAGVVSVETGPKAKIQDQVSQSAEAERKWVHRTLGEQAAKADVPVDTSDVSTVIELLDHTLMAIGNEVAELFLFNRPARGEISQIEEIVSFYCGQHSKIDRAPLYQKTLKRLLLDPAEGDEDLLFKRLQAYFIASAYVLNPTSEKLLADYAKEHWVYLDSSILLPALAIGHPAHAVYKHLLHATNGLGMKLKVIPDMLNEVQANVRSARKAFQEFRRTGVALKEVLEGSVVLSGTGNGNVFLEGYLNRLRIDSSLTPESYMANVLGKDGNTDESAIVSTLAEMYTIQCDNVRPDEIDGAELQEITTSIEHLRKHGGRFKTRLLCEHEARQFVVVHLRRRQNPGLATKIWFVTTDHFITELQKLERDRYPLPMSYTPRMWFQYLNLVDTGARGSEHFSRLQPKLRFGVVTGDLGIEAIKTLLTEQKTLIEQGVVTVKELAEAAVRDYHIRQSLSDYDRTVGSRREEDIATAKTRIRADMKKAVKQFVAVRTQELDRLTTEREAATTEAAKLRKQLAKKDYIVRNLRKQAKPVKPVKRKRRKR